MLFFLSVVEKEKVKVPFCSLAKVTHRMSPHCRKYLGVLLYSDYPFQYLFIADKITHTQNLIRIPALLSSSWWWTWASFILTVWIGIFTVDRIICYNSITQSRTDHLSNKEIKTIRFGICFIFLIMFLLNLSIRSTVDKNLNMVLVSSYTWHGVIFFRITIGHNGSLFSFPGSSCLSSTNS